MNDERLIDNDAWLAGYAAYERGEGCPCGDPSARLGWIKAKNAAEAIEPDPIAVLGSYLAANQED